MIFLVHVVHEKSGAASESLFSIFIINYILKNILKRSLNLLRRLINEIRPGWVILVNFETDILLI